MKDHEISAIVNELTREVKRICPDAPQQLRQVISRVIVEGLKSKETGELKRPNFYPDVKFIEVVGWKMTSNPEPGTGSVRRQNEK